jgi:(E)-4-hydroxy-3-methylbut-2-enyl-diphosphate synthase
MKTREIKIGNIRLGGKNPVIVQGMVKASIDNSDLLILEAREMIKAGVQMIRCAVPSEKDVLRVYEILKKLKVPLIADCHFQTKIAIKAIETGFNKVRVNPGNMSKVGMKKIIDAAKSNKTVLRFGFNSGSYEVKTGGKLADCALRLDEWVKGSGFKNFIISLKSSSVVDTVEANRFFSTYSDTPLHIGISAFD